MHVRMTESADGDADQAAVGSIIVPKVMVTKTELSVLQRYEFRRTNNALPEPGSLSP